MTLIETFSLQNYQINENQVDLKEQLKEDVQDIMLIDKSKMLGREYQLGKNTNPLLDLN